jgi:hypothetical protein
MPTATRATIWADGLGSAVLAVPSTPMLHMQLPWSCWDEGQRCSHSTQVLYPCMQSRPCCCCATSHTPDSLPNGLGRTMCAGSQLPSPPRHSVLLLGPLHTATKHETCRTGRDESGNKHPVSGAHNRLGESALRLVSRCAAAAYACSNARTLDVLT